MKRVAHKLSLNLRSAAWMALAALALVLCPAPPNTHTELPRRDPWRGLRRDKCFYPGSSRDSEESGNR